ncbi:MAG TPA: adenine phosphoribosyltransferase [Vicinamibacterales bacterium]|nr:adenine phosphoribosyltransferase [Vicinamibacterales bacterium]
MDHLKKKIREIPDFPKPGILFYDITTLLCDSQGFRDTVDALAAPFMGEDIDQVIGIESRGFILGAAVANLLGCGFVPVRKPGKLPGATHKEAYSLEYGENALEIHQDACATEKRILVVDDVLATGGTAKATLDLARKAGGNVIGIAFLIELDFLNGRAKLPGENVYSVLHY